MIQEEIDYFVSHFYHETFEIHYNNHKFLSGLICNPNKGQKVALNWVNCNVQLRIFNINKNNLPVCKSYWIPLAFLLKASCYIRRDEGWIELYNYLENIEDYNDNDRYLIQI